ncbi:sodium/proline symporter [Winogradskyella sp.]|uniref:sodium/proline symporter n=1 Tax=Winogradskyella sp. TaxID=1883156 RepID=UPI003BAB88EC
MITFYFTVFLLLLIGIGIYSHKLRKNNSEDYLLASSNVSPMLSGISAAASTFSGFMFTGFVGYIFVHGISAIWFIFFMFLGEFLSTNFNKFIQKQTEKTGSLTYIELITKLTGGYEYLRKILALVVVLFLGIYASSQILSSTKALEEILNWNQVSSIVIAAVIILTYSFYGGIRASIWTDAAQGLLMLIAVGLLSYYALNQIGGITNLYTELEHIDYDLVSFYPKDLKFGLFAFAIGWLFHGMGLLGQPHVMNRYMALKKGKTSSRNASLYFMFFTILFVSMLFVLSLTIRVYYANSTFDQEIALLKFSNEFFSDFFLGLILAGIFASTISTADSQILVCSSAVVRDLFAKKISPKKAIYYNKIATLAITVFIALIAIYGSKSIFKTVVMSWSVLGVAFTPLLVLAILKQKVSQITTLAMLIFGVGTTIVWNAIGYGSNGIPAFLPGFLVSLLVFLLSEKLIMNKVLKKA